MVPRNKVAESRKDDLFAMIQEIMERRKKKSQSRFNYVALNKQTEQYVLR